MSRSRIIKAALCVFVLYAPAPAHAADLLQARARPAFCHLYQQHVPDADVTYQPGVDVHGRPVAGADLPGGSSIRLPDSFTVPLTLDLFEQLGLDQQFPGLEGKLDLGQLSIEGDRVTLGGQVVPSLSRADLVAICGGKPTLH